MEQFQSDDDFFPLFIDRHPGLATTFATITSEKMRSKKGFIVGVIWRELKRRERSSDFNLSKEKREQSR
jgi:hypothetical protein